MKRKITITFVSMLLCFTAASLTGANLVNENGSPYFKLYNSIECRDIWNVKFRYEVGDLSGSGLLAGIEFDGTNFYVPEWNNPTIYKFDRDGNYLDSFTISGVPSINDLAYDGTYFYGAAQNPGNVIFIMDMENQLLIGTITAPVVAWNIAYDASADNGVGGFWIGQWDYVDVTLIDRSGNILDSFPPPESMYGLAWDNISKIEGFNGPFLWIFTGVYTGDDGIIKVVDLETKTLIPGVEHNVADDLGQGIAGGLGFTTEWDKNYAILFGIVQSNRDYAFGYEMCIKNYSPEIPQIPSGLSDGEIGVEYLFTTNTTDPEGDDIYYLFNWGDGSISNWIGPYKSGEIVEAVHTWDNIGVYNVRVKAKDELHSESNWSEPNTINIYEKLCDIGAIEGGLFKVNVTIRNYATKVATGVNWSIKIDGGFMLLGKETTGTKDIPASGEITIASKLILGFGSITVEVIADGGEFSDTRKQTGFVLLFFIKVNPGD